MDDTQGFGQALGEWATRDRIKALEQRVEELERQVQQLTQAVFPLG